MKKSCAVALFVLILTGCYDARVSTPVVTENKFSKSVGAQIPLEVAERWMALYSESNISARSEDVSYSITPDHLKAVASYATDAGLAFHHAIDDVGLYHILIVPIKDTLLLNLPVLIDANSDTVIDSSTAKAWIRNYQVANPTTGWYHFFGYDIFIEIFQSSFSRMDIEPAINDEGKPQLLLMVWPQTIANGKVNASSPTVYDMSSLCPPCSK